jgi:hypothetical protein
MSRSGYSEDMENNWELICWRGAVASAIRGKRGQEFLRSMLSALDAMPEKRLIEGDLERDGDVCAIGSVGKMRGIDMSTIDPEDYDGVAKAFGISPALAREIECVNDEWLSYRATPEQRFECVRKWVVEQLPSEKATA